MTICRYYLQGNCRFGDRCRFEHSDYTRPDNSNRRNDNYHKSQHYDTSYEYEDNSYDPSYNYRRDSYSDTSYNYKKDSTYNDRYHPNYGKHERQNETYYSARYDDKGYRYSQQKPETARSYNQYKYESPQQYRSSDHSEDGYNSRTSKSSLNYNTSTPKSKVTFSFKDPDSTPKHKESEDLLLNEHNVFLAEVMRKDAQEWEEGKMWPFTSYSPKMNASNFPGFHDFSPEELMLEAYKAMKTNAYSSFVESAEKTVLDVKNKIKELKNPTGPLMFMIDKYRKGEFPDMDIVDAGKFLKCSSTTEEMIAEEPQLSQNSLASSFSFKTVSEADSAVKSSLSAFSFKTVSEADSAVKSSLSTFSFNTVSEADSAVKSSLSTFSFKIPSETNNSIRSSASAFSFKLPAEPVSMSRSLPSAQDGPSDIYTPSDQISLQDKEQFLASTFTLGKIPTVPPARYMCM